MRPSAWARLSDAPTTTEKRGSRLIAAGHGCAVPLQRQDAAFGLGALKRRPYKDAATKKSGRACQREVTPFARVRKKGRLPTVWATMPGQVFFVRWAMKDRARPVMAMRVVSQRVGCMKRWKADQRIP